MGLWSTGAVRVGGEAWKAAGQSLRLHASQANYLVSLANSFPVNPRYYWASLCASRAAISTSTLLYPATVSDHRPRRAHFPQCAAGSLRWIILPLNSMVGGSRSAQVPSPPSGSWRNEPAADPSSILALNWCEEDYYATVFSAEIANAFTNLLFLHLAVRGVRNCLDHGHDPIFLLTFLGYGCVGLGSFAFHTTLKCKN